MKCLNPSTLYMPLQGHGMVIFLFEGARPIGGYFDGLFLMCAKDSHSYENGLNINVLFYFGLPHPYQTQN